MNIVITGASNGIGYFVAKKFATDASNKIIAIARDAEKLNKLKSEINAEYKCDTLIPLAMDLTDPRSMAGIQEQVGLHMSELDVLICNAGSIINKPFDTISPEELKQVYEVNVFAPYLLIQALLPSLRKSEHAQVILIGSMGGMNGTVKFPGLSAYSSSKGALSILAECLAEELKKDKIRVNCLALGSVNTNMLKKAFPEYVAPHEPAEMADFITEFALKSSHFFNGKTIPVSSATP
ncbi:MAG: SDR family oxidoreductase [Bacteroidetes bacterium]|nr:SDR family oxidoreductase [Bacteroidota bacterium]